MGAHSAGDMPVTVLGNPTGFFRLVRHLSSRPPRRSPCDVLGVVLGASTTPTRAPPSFTSPLPLATNTLPTILPPTMPPTTEPTPSSSDGAPSTARGGVLRG